MYSCNSILLLMCLYEIVKKILELNLVKLLKKKFRIFKIE